MPLKLKTKPASPTPVVNHDMPCWSPKNVEQATGGAVTVTFLKNDRLESEHNGTPPKIPFFRFGYRTIKYAPNDVKAFIAANRIS